MTEFITKLSNRFFDFFNAGRLLTIFVPGLVAALCLGMLLSQLLFAKVADNGDKEVSSSATVVEKAVPAGKVTAGPEKADLLSMQVYDDFQRVANHLWLLTLLAVILGFPIYEIGYAIQTFLTRHATTKQYALHPYKTTIVPGAHFHMATDQQDNTVGIMYFAPFMQEKFSGEENYFNFFVTEFYRFQEFSTVMPVSILFSATSGLAYYLLFALRTESWPHHNAIIALCLSALVSAGAYLYFVTRPGLQAYAKSKHDFILGISAYMERKHASGASAAESHG